MFPFRNGRASWSLRGMHVIRWSLLWLLGSAGVLAQVSAGGGGVARPDQFYSTAPAFSTPLFVKKGDELTPHERAKRDAAWRAEIRRELFVPSRLPALQAHRWSTFSPMAGVLADRVTYATADGMRVPAIIYRPDPAVFHWKGKLPGIVVVNGHGGDKFSWYAIYSGLLFARAGAVVVTYDPIGEGERNARRASAERPSPHDQVVDLPHWGQRLAGLMQVDLMQGVSYLLSQPEVDRSRIAVLGYSMGSFVTGIAGAVDTRIHATVLSGGGTFDGPHGDWDSGKLPCQAPPYRALGVLGDRAAILYALNADRGPMLVMNGDADTVMHMSEHPPAWFAEVRARAIRVHGSDANMFTTILYPGVGHRPSWVDLAGALWLYHQIHFALWDDQALRAAGTTLAAEWISANHMDVARSNLRMDREGGIEAVGRNFPSIPRDLLMVLPESEWQAERAQLTYESWAEKTKRAEGVQ
jgi:dienelactone hydrolase